MGFLRIIAVGIGGLLFPVDFEVAYADGYLDWRSARLGAWAVGMGCRAHAASQIQLKLSTTGQTALTHGYLV